MKVHQLISIITIIVLITACSNEPTSNNTAAPNATISDITVAYSNDDITAEDTSAPSDDSSADVTAEPSDHPNADVTAEPSDHPNADVTAEPSDDSSADVTAEPSDHPNDDVTTETSDHPSADVTAETSDDSSADVTTEPSDHHNADVTTDPPKSTSSEPAATTTIQVVASGTVEIGHDSPFDFNDDYITDVVGSNYPSPYATIDTITYTPSTEDVIAFNPTLSGLELFNSASHSGFSGIVTTYDQEKLSWTYFFESLDYSNYMATLTTTLMGKNIYEERYIDEHEKYYRFYSDTDAIYYEVNDLMLGNYLDEDAVLTRSLSGMSVYYGAFDEVQKPSYNPLDLQQKNEYCLYATITTYNDEPAFFYESADDRYYYQHWVSIHDGVTLKKITFDDEGRPTDIKSATSVERKDIDPQIFIQSYDVDFKDITLMIYSMENSDKLSTFGEILVDTLPSDEFSMILESQNDSLEIHSGGFGDSIGSTIYLSKAKDINEEEVTLISFKDKGYFTTICPEKELVTLYGSSLMQHKFFDFEATGFVGYKEEGDLAYYTFRDVGYDSVSGLIKFYDYEINGSTKTFSKVRVYHKDDLHSSQIVGDLIDYTILSFGEADESLASYPETYEVFDYGPDSHNDGEHLAPWYE